MKPKNNEYLTREEFQNFLKKFDQFLEEDRKRREEDQRKWEEQQRKWEENQKIINETLSRLKHHDDFIEEERKRREEDQRRWEENQKVINRMLSQLTRHGDFIGFGVEGMASILLRYYLEEKHGLKIKELRKKLFSSNGQKVEINLYWEGKKGRKKYIVLVECKATIGKKSVKDFLKKIRFVERHFGNEKVVIIKILFGPLILPEAAELARKHNIEMVSNVPQEV